MSQRRAILWLRRDLRLDDHAALSRLLADGYQPIPVYLHAPDELAPWQPGAANRWWLHHSLSALQEALRQCGSELVIRVGASLHNLRRLIAETGAEAVYWHRLYEPAVVTRDVEIKSQLREQGIVAHSCAGHLLAEPDRLLNQAGAPYRVFTPYSRVLLARLDQLGAPVSAPSTLPPVPSVDSLSVAQLGLLPRLDWDAAFYRHWHPGEAGAHAALAQFADESMANYAEERDRPDHSGTSALSAHLHFGEISVRRIATDLAHQSGADTYMRQLAWRDYSHYLLRHFPHTTEQSLNPRFANFDWLPPDPAQLSAWQRGRTGIPLVDAGMRQLWQTGWMHNRVRMVVASVLCKNLRMHWLHGARWFWDCLVDADLANNTQGWQWTAGTGVDAAPYFRIFNPVTQSQRFDPNGDYIRQWVPELRKLDKGAVHQPWKIGGVSGYPPAIVDLKGSARAALGAFQALRDAD